MTNRLRHLLLLCFILDIAASRVALAAAPDAPPRRAPRSATDSEEEQGGLRSESRLYFREEWRRFDAIEYVATAAVVVGLVYVEFGTDVATEGDWSGGVLFDDEVRTALRAESAAGRNRAGTASDWPSLFPQVLAVVDGFAIPLIFGDLDLAWQMTAMNIQAFATNGLLTRSGHRFVRRERPDTKPCSRDPDYDQSCFGGSYASFPGGHTSTAMTGAGLVCAHHAYVPLYGARWADLAACGVNVGMGLLGGALRIVADRHYVSDVVVGAGLGFGLGFGLPVLLHYEAGSKPEHALRITPWLRGDAYGASASRAF